MHAVNSLPDRSHDEQLNVDARKYMCVYVVGRDGEAHKDLGTEKFMVFAINKIVLISMYAILFRHKKCTRFTLWLLNKKGKM